MLTIWLLPLPRSTYGEPRLREAVSWRSCRVANPDCSRPSRRVYANNNRPLGSGIGRPSSFAVSIHSSITTSTLASASCRVKPVGGAPGELGDFGDERLVFVVPVENDFVFSHSSISLHASRDKATRAISAQDAENLVDGQRSFSHSSGSM